MINVIKMYKNRKETQDMVLYWTKIAHIQGLTPGHPGRTAAHGSAWAWSLLAYAVREQFSCDLPEVSLSRGGKPFFPSRPDICFSLSHTKTAVLAAISSFPIGADVEFRRETKPSLERRLLELPHGDLDLFEVWTLRESWYKLTGEGDLRSIPFSRENGVITGPNPALQCRVYHEIPDCCASVCSLSETLSNNLLYVPPEALCGFST